MGPNWKEIAQMALKVAALRREQDRVLIMEVLSAHLHRPHASPQMHWEQTVQAELITDLIVTALHPSQGNP